MTHILIIARKPELDNTVISRTITHAIEIEHQTAGPDGYGDVFSVDAAHGQPKIERLFGDVARIFSPMTIAAPVRFDAV